MFAVWYNNMLFELLKQLSDLREDTLSSMLYTEHAYKFITCSN